MFFRNRRPTSTQISCWPVQTACHLTKYIQFYWQLLLSIYHSNNTVDMCSGDSFKSVFLFFFFFFSLTFHCRHMFTRQINVMLLFWVADMLEMGQGFLAACPHYIDSEFIQPDKHKLQYLLTKEVSEFQYGDTSLCALFQAFHVLCLPEIFTLWDQTCDFHHLKVWVYLAPLSPAHCL